MDLYEMLLKDLNAEGEEIDEIATCFRCEKQVHIPYRKPMERFYCDECAELEDREYQETLATYVDAKKKVTFEEAIRTLEKSGRYNLNEIRDEVLDVKQMYLSGDYEFLSSFEVITAIVLKVSKIGFEINKPIGKYKIDFYIPSKTICLEIDGNLHEMHLVRDGRRDVEIRQILGGEWETIRIPTKYVKNHPDKIPEFLDEMYKTTKEERNKHGGILPRNFSKSTKAYYDTVFTDEYVTHARK